HLGKALREIDPDLVPVARLALHAADAVVVAVAELIHGREFNAGALHHAEAIRMGDAALMQDRPEVDERLSLGSALMAALVLFGSVSKNYDVVGLLEAEA